MEKKEFESLMKDILTQYGFKKKGMESEWKKYLARKQQINLY